MATISSRTSKTAALNKTAPVPTCDKDSTGFMQIPIIQCSNNAKMLPTFTAAISRPNLDSLPVEHLDNIQLELEKMLTSAAMRTKTLRSQYEGMCRDENHKQKQTSVGEKSLQATTPGTASTSKRKREDIGSGRKPKSSTLKRSKQAKISSNLSNTDDSSEFPSTSAYAAAHGHGQTRDHHAPKASLPKNDTPHKFWLSVEPYCMPVTNEDLRMLDSLLERYNGPLVPPIPDLGPHYSNAWAAEDINEQASNPSNSSNRLKPQNSAPEDMLKKADTKLADCVTGPLTQRLVSALIEEKVITNPSELSATVADTIPGDENPLKFKSLAMMRNCVTIEQRVKKELIEQGILSASDFPFNDEDEIYEEIKRQISELSTVAEFNQEYLRRLRLHVVDEMERLDIKRKLDVVDQELMETYKRSMQNKAKRRPMLPDEKQEIFRLAAQQRKLSALLERSRRRMHLYD